MMFRGLVIGALLLGPAIASGDPLGDVEPQELSVDGQAPLFGFVGEQRADGLVMARQVVPAPSTTVVSQDRTDGTSAVAQSRIIYLNKNGVTLSPAAVNDARTNKSTIVSTQTLIQGWNANATVWSDTVSCVRDLFKDYDVQVVDQDPGNVPHIEAVFGGTPTQVGMAANVAGVSPFTTDCSIIENSVVFTFTNAFTFTAREACEIMAQEIAHSYGLDHELLASDPMTYLPYSGNRSFQNTAASCGESTQRVCGINGSTCRQNQNSVQLLTARLGTSTADAVAPTLAFNYPANNATVPPGFQVKASGSDNIAVTGAVLKIDGTQVDEQTGAGPFVFTTSSSLGEGSHTVVVEISDGKNIKSDSRTVTVKIGATPPQDTTGTGGGDGEDPYGSVSGGCSAGGGAGSAWFALGLLALTARRRRNRR